MVGGRNADELRRVANGGPAAAAIRPWPFGRGGAGRFGGTDFAVPGNPRLAGHLQSIIVGTSIDAAGGEGGAIIGGGAIAVFATRGRRGQPGLAQAAAGRR